MFSLLKRFRRPTWREPAEALYVSAVNQARQVPFYADLGVPDTVDGRFDLLILHVYMILRRLKSEHTRTTDLAQELFDILFADMDQNLREMGVGDMGVGKRVKGMAKAFYGRVAAYDDALEKAGRGWHEAVGVDHADPVTVALRRNLYRKTEPSEQQVAALAAYLRHQVESLNDQPLANLLAGQVRFAAPPSLAGRGEAGTGPLQAST